MQSLLENAKLFVVDNSSVQETHQPTPVTFEVAGQQLNIEDGMVDPHVIVSANDIALKTILEYFYQQLKHSIPTPKNIVATVNKLYPIDTRATTHVRKFRKDTSQAKLLGDYFVSEGDVPYTAVCIHKAMLTQALLSLFGIDSSLITFGFAAQIKDGVSDNQAGIHSVLVIKGERENIIADAHKRICLSESEYFSLFQGHQVFDHIGTKVFSSRKDSNINKV